MQQIKNIVSYDTQVMRIIEALEGKGCRSPLMKGEAELAEKLASLTRQVLDPGLLICVRFL